MTSRLAFNPIVLSAGDITVLLRPSLRAGLLMAQKYSVDELLEQLRQCRLGTISHLVAIGCDDIDKATQFIAAKIAHALYPLEELVSPLIDFIALSFACPNDSGDNEPATSKPISFADIFTELYEFATGWLQWSPADTWAATPAEIVHARNGHFAMLRAIHGNGEDTNSDPRDLPSEQEVKAGISKLRQLANEVG